MYIKEVCAFNEKEVWSWYFNNQREDGTNKREKGEIEREEEKREKRHFSGQTR